MSALSTNLYTVSNGKEADESAASQRESRVFVRPLYTIFHNRFAWKYQMKGRLQALDKPNSGLILNEERLQL
jgi:hypothetical protein